MHNFLVMISYHRVDDVGIIRKCMHYYGNCCCFLSQTDVTNVTAMTSSMLQWLRHHCIS